MRGRPQEAPRFLP